MTFVSVNIRLLPGKREGYTYPWLRTFVLDHRVLKCINKFSGTFLNVATGFITLNCSMNHTPAPMEEVIKLSGCSFIEKYQYFFLVQFCVSGSSKFCKPETRNITISSFLYARSHTSSSTVILFLYARSHTSSSTVILFLYARSPYF